MANNNQMVLARKVPVNYTPDDVVERYFGMLYDGIVDGKKIKAPPECDPQFTVQVGKYPVFLDGSKLPLGFLYPGELKSFACFYNSALIMHPAYRSVATRHFYCQGKCFYSQASFQEPPN